MRRNERVRLTKYLSKVFETPSTDYSEWFGYYNYDTLNSDQTKMLCNRSIVDGVSPQKGMEIELGYYSIPFGEWHHIGTSDSWNWQQGAMLQWLPGEGNEDLVIYNTSKEGRLISVIHNTRTGDNRELSWPIYGITPDGMHSISLEFERSYWCRAYHYPSVINERMNGRVYEGDGIFDIDCKNNSRRRIISIHDIIQTDYRPEFQSYKHWVEHIMISPTGKRFCFLHRFSPENDVLKYYTRLMIANIDGTDLISVPGWDKYYWSHFGWKDDDTFVIYTRINGKYNDVGSLVDVLKHKPIQGLRKKFLVSLSARLPYMLGRKLSGIGKYYQVYSLNTENQAVLVDKIESSLFDIDGHPSFTGNGRYMITDSYPDGNGYQRLILYGLESRKGAILARLFANYKGNPASCDLHPKLCKNNDYLVIDTAFNQKHHMIVFKIDWSLIPF